MSDLNFAHIRDTVPILDVARWLGVSGLVERASAEHGVQWVGKCPMSGQGSNAFKLAVRRNRFICFCTDCKKLNKNGGDDIELVSRVKKIGHREAAEALQAQFLNGAGKAPANASAPVSATEPPLKVATFDPRNYVASLVPDHPALKELPCSAQSIRDFDGGYCLKGVHRGRLALPFHDEKGEIVGFLGLALGPEQPEVQYPKGFEVPRFFNLYRAKGTLCLVANIRDVLRAWENGLEDAVCPLRPLTPDMLDYLSAFMREHEIAEVETL